MSLKKFSILNSPADWHFKNPEDKFIIKGKDLKEVASKVRMYRAQNQFEPLEYLESVIENYLCMLPRNQGSCERMLPLKRGLYTSLRGGIAIVLQMMYNSFATQEVADARALICVGCKLNTFPDKTAFVTWADSIAQQTVGDRRSKYHEEIGNCSGCTCLLRSKVFFDGKIKLKLGQESEMRDASKNCWQLPENNK